MLDYPITVGEGRRLQVYEDGDPDGQAILVEVGTPNSRLLFPPWGRLARRQGVRLISYDRPGYGGSDRQAGRTIADGADDVRAIANALEIERLGVWGISGGGPYALGCAALLQDLVAAVATMASPAPYPVRFEDDQSTAEEVESRRADPVAARAELEEKWGDLADGSVSHVLGRLDSLLSPADKEVASEEFGEWFVANIQEGLAPGMDGWFDDGRAEDQDWGFDVESISTPVLVLQGRHDRMVPFGHGQWLAEHVPGCEAVLSDEDGHLTFVQRRLDWIHEWLLERM